MKIGIITCWQPDDNYGTQIQCFSFIKYLEKIGHEPFLIRYHRFEDVNKNISFTKLLKAMNPYLLIKWLIGRSVSKKSAKEAFLHNRDAVAFREKYLSPSKDYYCYEELKQDPPKADCYVVGSDQVWNIYYTQVNNLNAHLLNFGDDNILRFSYASSFGFNKQKLIYKYSKIVYPLLKRFDYISVREQSGLEVLNKIGITNGEQVCDPTMLLEPSDYINYFSNEKKQIKSKKYVFVYEINSSSELNYHYIKEWAVLKNLDVIYVPAHGLSSNNESHYLSISEWVIAISNAEYVITNSFHGTVFSCLFHKPVVIYPLKGKSKTTNSRIDILLKLLNKDIVLYKQKRFDYILESFYDWDIFDNNLRTFKETGIQYLNKVLNERKEIGEIGE